MEPDFWEIIVGATYFAVKNIDLTFFKNTKRGPFFWMIINQSGQPLYSAIDGKMFIFKRKEDAKYYIKAGKKQAKEYKLKRKIFKISIIKYVNFR